MKYPKEDYLAYDPFEGDIDVDIRCRTVKLLKTRAPHKCMTPWESHVIPAGSMARFEKAFVDRSHWGSYYTCLECMDVWLDEVIGQCDDEFYAELKPAELPLPTRCERTVDMFGGVA